MLAAFVDFRDMVPLSVGHWLASIQFTPSLIALLTGAGFGLACVLIALASLACGRFYCSTLCPLGILQDVVIRLRRLVGSRRRPMRYAAPRTVMRYAILWAVILASLAGAGSAALVLLDPYSHFGRIASGIFRPLATIAGNAGGDAVRALGGNGGFRYDVVWPSMGALAFPIVILALIVGLAAWRGRLYCNTICPVGTVLGWLAKRAAFRLRIDSQACEKCAACMRACKAQCIDLKGGKIDFSRCVGCFDCLPSCEKGAIGFRWSWGNGGARKIKPKLQDQLVVDGEGVCRRDFLVQSAQGMVALAGVGGLANAALAGSHPAAARRMTRPGIAPPGARSVKSFIDRCTGCHLCVSACPTHVLQPALLEYGVLGFMKPHMNYPAAFCDFDCHRCGDVCPDGALAPLDLASKHLTRIGEAQFCREECIVVRNGTDCAACSEHCPTKAVSTVPYGSDLRLPSLDTSLCIGCGACEYACPVKAITVSPLAIHGTARKAVENRATLPKSSGDFPF
jgi:ferredoxin-type protein NapF